MSAIKNVVLVGAGGNLGPSILAALDAAGFNVTVLSRKSSTSTFGSHKVVKVSDDYPHAELVQAFKGHEAVVTTISAAGQSVGSIKLVDAAIEAGVRRFIPNEWGCDNRNKAAVELCPVFGDKKKVVDYLEARKDKIEYTAIVSGPFFDWCLEKAFTGIDLEKSTAKLVAGGDNKFSTATLPQIGSHVAAVLKHPEETANKYVPIESFLVSQKDILAAVEKATSKKFQVEHQAGEALINGAREGMKAGNPHAIFGLIQAAIFVPGYGSSFHDEASQWMSKLGEKPLDLYEEVAKVVSAKA